MNRVLTFIGLITCIIGLCYGINYIFQNYSSFTANFFYYFGMIAFIDIIILIALRLYYGDNWIVEGGKDTLIGSDLISAINQTLNELPNPSKPTLSKLGGHLVYRFTRLGIIGLCLASIPIWLLWQQNEKMDIQTQMMNIQNDKIDIQNDKINIQNSLIEAERRSSLVFLMSNVLDKVDDEIKEQRDQLGKNIDKNTKYSLSKPLINRIVALSKTFKPYKMLDGDTFTLSNNLISPERAQLFTALINNNLDSMSQNSIVSLGNFSNSSISDLKIEKAQFIGAKVKNLILENVNFHNSDLSGSNFRGSKAFELNTSNCTFRNAILDYIECKKCDFNSTRLSSSSFLNSNLEEVTFNSSDLTLCDFTGANLHNTSFDEAFLSYINFSDAILTNSRLIGHTLSNVNFKNANLKNTRFDYSNFIGVRFLTKEQLLQTKSLYNCTNLDPKIKAALEKEKPCLFTESGCR